MKMIYMIGLPGSGKTTVMRKFMSEYEWKNDKPADLLDTQISSKNKLRVLGKYEDDQVFGGTDRLSMAVAPKAIEWLQNNLTSDENIVGEGDRLNNQKFFETCGDRLTILHLTVSDEERKRRYKERGSDQSEKFIQTVKTKCKNIIEKFGDQQTLFGVEKGVVVEMVHETEEDTKKIVDFMKKTLDI